jgi:RimJ/RimL family protein N-acetyltransferase
VTYLLAKELPGQGSGIEAARGIVQYGFEHLHLSHPISLVDAHNMASARVALKTGMTLEKQARDESGPCLPYSMVIAPSTRPRRPIEGEQR